MKLNVIEKRPAGCLYGRIVKNLEVSGFVLTETAHLSGSRYPLHAHENAYFCFVLQGMYTERYRGRDLLYKPFTLTFRSSGETHEDLVHAPGGRVFVLEIPALWVEKLHDEGLTLRPTLEVFNGTLPQLAARLNQEFHKSDGAARLAIEGLVLEMLAEAVRKSSTISESSIPPWLRQAREMIIEQFSESWSLEQLASQVGVHPVHLAKTFRQKYGQPVGAFVRKLRIDYACAELASDVLSVSAIALKAGFADQSHFTKTFKSHLGTTPARYRRNAHRY